jgi:hypothetical protein
MKQLVVEAKEKVKPTELTPEMNKYFKKKEDLEKNKQIVNIDS